jgi:LPXTG-site transpeptidase (sortase) family protein
MNKQGCAFGALQMAILGSVVGVLTLVCVGMALWTEGIVESDSLFGSAQATVVRPIEGNPVAYATGYALVTSTPVADLPVLPSATATRLPPPSPAPLQATATAIFPTDTPTPEPLPTASPAATSLPVTPLPPPPAQLTADSGLPEKPATRLVIPSLGLDAPVVLVSIVGDTWQIDDLGQSVGHLEGTASPGFNSNIVLAGHITLEPDGRDGPFIGLGYLNPGDSVIVYHQEQAYTYQVDYMTSVKPTDVQVTYPSLEPKLTLITCLNYDRSLAHYTDRLIVVGHLVGEVAN